MSDKDCGGTGTLSDECDYYAVRLRSKFFNFDLLAPCSLEDWLYEVICSVMHTLDYQGKKRIDFVFVVGKVNKKNKDFLGYAYKESRRIIIVMNKKSFGVLKRLNLRGAVSIGSSNLRCLVDIIWHEVNHLKRKKKSDFPSKSDYYTVLDFFYELYQDESEVNG